MSIDGARQLGDWISGASAARQRRANNSRGAGSRAGGSIVEKRTTRKRGADEISPQSLDPSDSFELDEPTPTLTRSAAPVGFWEPEVPYEEHASTSAHSGSDTGATGIEGVDVSHPGPSTLILDFIDPGKVTLEMTKTTMPIYKYSKNGTRLMVETASYVVVTTVPKSSLVQNGLSRIATIQDNPEPTGHAPRSIDLPAPPSPTRLSFLPETLSNQITPTDEIMALDLAGPSEGQSTRPLYFRRDGTISRPRGPLLSGVDERGKPLDVRVLLDITDWSQTGLGPRDKWPQSLKTAGKLTCRLS